MAADLQMACSVGPPTGSDTSIPTDQFSVGGDYVLILALPTEIGFTNRKEKPLRFGSLTNASLRPQRAFDVFFQEGNVPLDLFLPAAANQVAHVFAH